MSDEDDILDVNVLPQGWLETEFKPILKERLKTVLPPNTSVDNNLLDYVSLLVTNQRQQAQFVEDLEAFFGQEGAQSFADWLWEYLGKEIELVKSGRKAKLKKTDGAVDLSKKKRKKKRKDIAAGTRKKLSSGDVKQKKKKQKTSKTKEIKSDVQLVIKKNSGMSANKKKVARRRRIVTNPDTSDVAEADAASTSSVPRRRTVPTPSDVTNLEDDKSDASIKEESMKEASSEPHFIISFKGSSQLNNIIRSEKKHKRSFITTGLDDSQSIADSDTTVASSTTYVVPPPRKPQNESWDVCWHHFKGSGCRNGDDCQWKHTYPGGDDVKFTIVNTKQPPRSNDQDPTLRYSGRGRGRGYSYFRRPYSRYRGRGRWRGRGRYWRGGYSSYRSNYSYYRGGRGRSRARGRGTYQSMVWVNPDLKDLSTATAPPTAEVTTVPAEPTTADKVETSADTTTAE